ncbi:MAG: phosphoglucosamine mutase [Candidatus Orphnella occulta]|nr:phosphoglucosamine mutase [Candidatus Orphnella occulta]MDP8296846.1 phosphoglucosamine mutase [Candidatus Orphnella occulta]
MKAWHESLSPLKKSNADRRRIIKDMSVLFGTDGIRGKVGVYPLTEEMVYQIGRSAATYVKKANPHKRKSQHISIAKDTRVSGGMFEDQLIKGITSCGVDVIKLGVMTTPCAAFLAKKLNHDMGIVISASHNDVDDNGLKFFTHKGYKLSPKEELEIELLISSDDSAPTVDEDCLIGKVKDEPNPTAAYMDLLREIIKDSDLSSYKIGADCAYGAISYLVPQTAKELSIDIRSINNKPTGENINQECGSLHPNVISEYVVEEGLDCGFAFDGDGDRVILSDEKGQILDGDFILAIISKYLSEKNLLTKNSIVTTQMSNLGLEMAISQWGGRLIKTDVGDKYVLEKMLKAKLNLGGEQSGHVILLHHTTTGDGLLTALFILKIMAETGKTLSQLSRAMYKFPQILLNIDVASKKPIEELTKTKKAIEKNEKKLGSKGRLYIRYSGTENKLRIMVEGQNSLEIKDVAEDIAKTAREELECLN